MAREPYTRVNWAPGSAGGTAMSPTNFNKMDAQIKGIDGDLDAVEDAVAAIQAAIGGGAGADGYTYGTSFPAPTLGGPLFFNLTDHKLYVPGGDAWYNAGTGAAASGAGASNAPQNFTAVVNPDNTVSLAWDSVSGATAITVREKFASPNGVSGMPLAGNATSNTRSASSATSTREYYITATVGGVETAESNHVTVYLPYGSQPSGGGGQSGGSTGETATEIMGIGSGYFCNLGIGQRGSSHVDVPYSDLEDGYERAGYFFLNSAGDGAVFKSYMDGGKTSSNTSYARCETRELKSDGTSKAAWTIGSGKRHVFEYTFAVNHIQPKKPWVTIGQIHDASSDAMAIKLKGSSGGPLGLGDRTSLDLVLVIDDEDHATKLLTGYNANEGDSADQITVKVDVDGNTMKVYCNGVLKVTTSALAGRTGCYWKAGAYPQSHIGKGQGEDPAEYTQVTYYSHEVTHTPSIG